MITGRFRLEDFGGWGIRYFILTGREDAGTVLRALSRKGCGSAFLERAGRLLRSGRMDTGLTYTNPDRRWSVIVVSRTTDVWEFFNTLAHEIDHVEKHVSAELGFSPYSEDASYLAGEIVRGMFYSIMVGSHAGAYRNG